MHREQFLDEFRISMLIFFGIILLAFLHMYFEISSIIHSIKCYLSKSTAPISIHKIYRLMNMNIAQHEIGSLFVKFFFSFLFFLALNLNFHRNSAHLLNAHIHIDIAHVHYQRISQSHSSKLFQFPFSFLFFFSYCVVNFKCTS